VKEIANTGLLVSVHHSLSISANLEVFKVLRKGQAKKVYSFEEVSGDIIIKILSHNHHLFLATGEGDVIYNSRRSLLGTIPVKGKIEYHLYNFNTGKAGNIIKLIRKSKWRGYHSPLYGI